MIDIESASTPAGFTHHFETVANTRLHYVANGDDDRKTIVLLAGYPESWFAWRKVMLVLGQHYRVIALDLPGQGDSDKPLTATIRARSPSSFTRYLNRSASAVTSLPRTMSARGSRSPTL